MKRTVAAVDVTPRDGLQNENTPVTTEQKIEMIRLSAKAGFKEIEITATVNPKRMPQMADAVEVLNALPDTPGYFRWVLVPNRKGLERLIQANVKLEGIAFFSAASETFSRKNSNCTIKESVERFKDMLPLIQEAGWAERIYISTALGCPFEGVVDPIKVAELAECFFKLSGSEICIADTIGTGKYLQVKHLINLCASKIPVDKLSVHFHDTYGQGLINTFAALESGINKFDVSTAGAGGCPFAPGASGNLSAETAVYALDSERYDCSVNMNGLMKYSRYVTHVLGKNSPFVGMNPVFFQN